MRVLLLGIESLLRRRRLLVVLVTAVAMVAGGLVTPAGALPPASTPTSPANWSHVRTATPKLMGTSVAGANTYYFLLRLDNGGDLHSGNRVSADWTVPDGFLLDGKSYGWRILAADDGGETWATSSWSYFTVDLRAGLQPAFPVDAAGPVEVNLATGNALYRHGSSPRLGTVGGPLGLNLSYNSLVAGGQGAHRQGAAGGVELGRGGLGPVAVCGRRHPGPRRGEPLRSQRGGLPLLRARVGHPCAHQAPQRRCYGHGGRHGQVRGAWCRRDRLRVRRRWGAVVGDS